MSEEEFFNRLLNKIDKEFGYDVASTLELMFMTREKKIEQLENIRKEAIEFIKSHKDERNYYHPDNTFLGMKVFVSGYYNLLNILNKGSESNV